MTTLALDFEVVRPPSILSLPKRPKLQVPKLAYAIVLMLLRTVCYDLGCNRLAERISLHKFYLFPALRRWQLEKWVAQFRRQKLFPKATESELRELARDLIMSFMI